MPGISSSIAVRYGVAAASVVAAVLVRRLLDPLLGDRFPFATVFFAVLVAARSGGFGPAVLATLLGAAGSAWLLLPPRGSFAVEGVENQAGLLLYAAISLGVASIGSALRATPARGQTESEDDETERQQLVESLREAVERHRAMEEHLSALVEASATLTGTLEFPAVSNSILKLSERLLPSDAYAIWRFHPASGQWQIASSSGLSAKYQQESIRMLERSPGMPDRPVIANDVLELPFLSARKEAYRAEGIRSLLVVPLRIHGQICGTLVVYHRHLHHFDETEVRLATAVANLAAAIIGSADLYEEQAQLRAEALAHRERLRVMLASIGDAVIATDTEGRATFLNQVAEALTGWTMAEAEGRKLEEVFHIINEHTRQEVENPVHRVLREGRVVGLANHTVLIARDGREIPIDDSGAPIRTPEGQITGVVLIFRDVIERKQAERTLRLSEERFSRFMQHLPGLAWIKDLQGRYVYANEAALQVFRRRPEEIYGKSDDEIFPPETAAQFRANDRQALASESGVQLIESLEHEDGMLHYSIVSKFPIPGPDGKMALIGGMAIDITERKRAEQDAHFLADASAALAGLVDYESTLQKVARLAVPEFADWCAVDMLDESGNLRRLAVAHVDPSKVELAHELHRRYPADPASGQGVWNILRTGKSEIIHEIHEELLTSRVKDAERLRIVRELGLKSYMGVPLSVRGRVLGVMTFIAAESGRRYDTAGLEMAEDLAHRAAVAIENARLYQAAREADRRKDEFLALLGHELRNPLAPIANALNVLKLPGADAAITQRAREMMERQVEHMVRLVDDLLDVSRIMRGKVELRRQQVELATVIARAVEASQPIIDAEGHQLTVTLPPEPLWVNGDLVRLAQVVNNLLNNAAKYTDRGGEIRLTAAREDGEAVVRVRDTGIGIAPELLPRLFDMFFQAERRTKESQGGLGIGLSLVKRLVELHGGSVAAHSDGPGTGSEFVVRLPLLAIEDNSDPLSHAGTATEEKLPRRRVLVVDDNVDAADSLALLMRLQGLDVEVAYDGNSALQKAEAEPPAVAFLDLGMPKMDGYELARAFRTHPALKGVVLVALTGWGQPEDRQRTKEAGFNHHLVKPVEAGTLHNLFAELE
jgi:PAS domain S-box-containing protein